MAKRRIKSHDNTRTKLQNRLARMEGQAEALRQMIGKSSDWKKMLTLAASIDGAANQVSADLFRDYLESLTLGTLAAQTAREGLELILKRL